MNDFAKFNATLAKVNFNGKKTVVTLELDNRTAASNIDFLIDNIDEAVIVSLGDPQISLDLPVGEQRQGVTATVGSNGVVESVKDPEGEQAEFPIEDGEDEGEPDYTGKAVLFSRENAQIIFPIIDGFGRAPKKIEVFDGSRTYSHTMGEGEVRNQIGVEPVPTKEASGRIGYLVSELLAFGGELVDAPEDEEPDLPYEVGEEDLNYDPDEPPTEYPDDDDDPGIPGENQASQWMDENMDFGDEGRAS